MVEFQLDLEPEGFVEKAADALGVVERRVRGDLIRFRDFIESWPQPTGAWRGRVEGGRGEDDDDDDLETDGVAGREPTEIGRPG